MSVPTTRMPRSPFRRRARRSAAVPGAPEAVTRTVISRIAARCYLRRSLATPTMRGRAGFASAAKAFACDADHERLCWLRQRGRLGIDTRVDQLHEGVRIELEPERGRKCRAVGHHVDEGHQIVQRDVGAEEARGMEALEPLLDPPQPPRDLHVDGEPVRAFRREMADGRVESLLDHHREELMLVAGGELEEDRPLVREVVEDCAPGQADLVFQPGYGRALVAVAGKRPPGALQDLFSARLEMLWGDLRHGPTLQNRTYVLLSPRREPPP